MREIQHTVGLKITQVRNTLPRALLVSDVDNLAHRIGVHPTMGYGVVGSLLLKTKMMTELRSITKSTVCIIAPWPLKTPEVGNSVSTVDSILSPVTHETATRGH